MGLGLGGCCCKDCTWNLRFPPPCPPTAGDSYYGDSGPTQSYYKIQSVVDSQGNSVPIQGGTAVDLRPGKGTWTVTSVGTSTNGDFTYADNPAITTITDPGCPAAGGPNTIYLTPPTITSIRRTITFAVPLYFGAGYDDHGNITSAFPIRGADNTGFPRSGGFPISPGTNALRYYGASGSIGGQSFGGSGTGSVVGSGGNGNGSISFPVFIPFPGVSTLSFSFTWRAGSFLGLKFPSNEPYYLPNDVTYSWTVCVGDCPRSPTYPASGGWINNLEPNAASLNCPGGGGPYATFDPDTLASLNADFAAKIVAPKSMDIVQAAQSCPNRTGPACGCPSVPGRCALGKGDGGAVKLADCVDCIRNEGIAFEAHLNGFTGYGQHSIAIAKEMEKLGYPVTFHPIERDDAGFIPLEDFAKRRAKP